MGPIILLILLGVILILAELLLIQGGIITGLLGIGSLVCSSIYAFKNFGGLVGTIVVLIIVAIIIVILYYALSEKTWKKVTLNTEIDSKVDKKPIDKGIEQGMVGICTTRLNPIGRVMFRDNLEVEVQSVDGLLDAKTEVIVTRIEEEKIYVKANNK